MGSATLVTTLTALGVVSQSCGKKEAKEVVEATASAKSSIVSAAFPSDLVVTSPLAQKKKTTLNAAADEAGAADYDSKKTQLEKLTTATTAASCVYKFAAAKSANKPTCYGPQLYYKNHPDYVAGTGGGPFDAGVNGNLPGGDLGMWDAAEASGEACTAAKMNYEIGVVAEKVDMAINGLAMMMCVAAAQQQELPAVGATSDYTSAVTTALTGQDIGATISTATLERLADLDGKAVYKSVMKATTTAGHVVTVNMKHVRLDDENKTYKGKMWMSVVPSSTTTSNDPMASKTMALSILYHKASDTSVKYSLRQGNFSKENSTDAKMFDSSYVANLPISNDGYSWTLVDQNPTDGTGKVGYAWVAGTKTENVRSFVANVTKDSAGTKSGTGYAGFGDTMENVLKDTTLKTFLDRMICNWAGPSNSHTGAKFVQKQVMAMNTSGIFAASSSKISFVPRNSCGTSADTSPNGTFSYSKTETGTYTDFTNSNDLVSTTDAGTDIVPPTAPTDF